MHPLILSFLSLLIVGAAPADRDAPKVAKPARKCPPPVITAGAPKAGGPARKLNQEPPAALIATVAIELDGCPMMLVLDGGESGIMRGWTPAPVSELHRIQ